MPQPSSTNHKMGKYLFYPGKNNKNRCHKATLDHGHKNVTRHKANVQKGSVYTHTCTCCTTKGWSLLGPFRRTGYKEAASRNTINYSTENIDKSDPADPKSIRVAFFYSHSQSSRHCRQR